jgi:hypothetical protein
MIKLILLCLLAFGAYCALCVFAPSSWGTAFHVSGHSIPYIAIGVCVIGYIGYKSLK